VIEFLVNEAGIPVMRGGDASSETAMRAACRFGQTSTVRSLLDLGSPLEGVAHCVVAGFWDVGSFDMLG
jgi:hypothetical protein